MGTHLALAVQGAQPEDAQGPWDTHGRRALLMLGVWGGFLAGALLGSAATPRLGAGVLAVPILAMLALAAR